VVGMTEPKRTNRHYRISLWDDDKFEGSPAAAFENAGFSCVLFHPRPVTDECLFYHVSGPDEVPDWMQPCGIPQYIEAEVERALAK